MQNSTTIHTLTCKQETKGYYTVQFSPFRAPPIHSLQDKKIKPQQNKSFISPIRAVYPRHLEVLKLSRPHSEKDELNKTKVGCEIPIKFSSHLAAYSDLKYFNHRKILSVSAVLSDDQSQKRSIEISTQTANHNSENLRPRAPPRKNYNSKSPLKIISETDKTWKSAFSKDNTLKLKIGDKILRSLHAEGMNEDRYANIKFVMNNDRTKNQHNIQYPLSSDDCLILGTDPRYQVIEAVIREYSLDLVPENSHYFICQNIITKNYVVVFTGKLTPICKDCLLPICFELSYRQGFVIVCKSGFCPKKLLFTSKLSIYAVQDLWDIELSNVLDGFENKNLTERHEVSKMIQNGIYKHRDITRVVSRGNSRLKNRPTTSMSFSRNQSTRRQEDFMHYTPYQKDNNKNVKEEADLKDCTNISDCSGIKENLSLLKSPNKAESFLILKNSSIRDLNTEKEDEKKKFENGIFKLLEEKDEKSHKRSNLLKTSDKRNSFRNEFNIHEKTNDRLQPKHTIISLRSSPEMANQPEKKEKPYLNLSSFVANN